MQLTIYLRLQPPKSSINRISLFRKFSRKKKWASSSNINSLSHVRSPSVTRAPTRSTTSSTRSSTACHSPISPSRPSSSTLSRPSSRYLVRPGIRPDRRYRSKHFCHSHSFRAASHSRLHRASVAATQVRSAQAAMASIRRLSTHSPSLSVSSDAFSERPTRAKVVLRNSWCPLRHISRAWRKSLFFFCLGKREQPIKKFFYLPLQIFLLLPIKPKL